MKRRKKTRRTSIVPVLCISLLLSLAALSSLIVVYGLGKDKKKEVAKETGAVAVEKEQESFEEQKAKEEAEQRAKEEKRKELLSKVDYLATTYDYDGAIDLVKSMEGYANDAELQSKVSEIESVKATCVPVNIEEVTHIFYHSLVVDANRAFANHETSPQAIGNNQWMTTVSEFEKITQEMYDRGYVMVSIHDLYEKTTNAEGKEVFEPAEILLPPGKKAFVMSIDDLSYYHSYDGYGYAAKLILDENGKVTNEYLQPDGTMVTGAYDVVPLMDDFVEKHPDASYRGAKGIIALTGYNGVLGYRTDSSYRLDTEDLDDNKRKWMEENPGFSVEKERDEAKKVADAMKANGWEFASHTWGHLSVGDSSLERLQRDTEKWKNNVEPVVGPTDTIIFAHGQDLGAWGPYDSGNEKFQYFKQQGFSVFCNVDSNQYRTWIEDDYIRQGRRNLDGYRIYYNAIGEQDNISDLFEASEILDPQRPPVKPL